MSSPPIRAKRSRGKLLAIVEIRALRIVRPRVANGRPASSPSSLQTYTRLPTIFRIRPDELASAPAIANAPTRRRSSYDEAAVGVREFDDDRVAEHAMRAIRRAGRDD